MKIGSLQAVGKRLDGTRLGAGRAGGGSRRLELNIVLASEINRLSFTNI